MKVLAIIPARGGSKGVPRKNIRPLAGKPLIAYNIAAALASRYIQQLIVSTDDDEIAAIARSYGAEVVMRPAEISGDTASSESALLHVLEGMDEQPDLLVFLQCTSPLTQTEDIDGTIDALLLANADTALAVTAFHYFLWDALGEGLNHDKQKRLRRQEQKPQYLETGAIYVMRVAGFLQAKHRFFGKTVVYETPAERRLEIDEPYDFEMAEILIRKQEDAQRIKHLPAQIDALVLDFDGVMTDNRVLLDEDGKETVVLSRSDGMGISLLKKAGIPIIVLSTETNKVVAARCAKLGIPYRQGLADKLAALKEWQLANGFALENLIYLGNDINDVDCLQAVGSAVVVADAHPEILQYADFRLKSMGGNGAIRELADLILKKLGSETNAARH